MHCAVAGGSALSAFGPLIFTLLALHLPVRATWRRRLQRLRYEAKPRKEPGPDGSRVGHLAYGPGLSAIVLPRLLEEQHDPFSLAIAGLGSPLNGRFRAHRRFLGLPVPCALGFALRR